MAKITLRYEDEVSGVTSITEADTGDEHLSNILMVLQRFLQAAGYSYVDTLVAHSETNETSSDEHWTTSKYDQYD